MTSTQFFTALVQKTRRTHESFRITSQDRIRFGQQCPIEYLVGTSKGTVISAAKKLKLGELLLYRLMAAADGYSHGTIRTALLKATKVKLSRSKVGINE